MLKEKGDVEIRRMLRKVKDGKAMGKIYFNFSFNNFFFNDVINIEKSRGWRARSARCVLVLYKKSDENP